MRVLVLNSNYSPICSIDWTRALVLFFEGKAEVVEEYPDKEVRTISKSFKVPAVIRLLKWVKNKLVGLKFNRGAIFLRDKGTCQYCSIKLSVNDATFDHIIPKSKGGVASWTNSILSCYSCNQYKNNRTPEEAGMKLLSTPIKPESLPMDLNFTILNRFKEIPESWKTYLRS